MVFFNKSTFEPLMSCCVGSIFGCLSLSLSSNNNHNSIGGLYFVCQRKMWTSLKGWLKFLYVVFAFCAALLLGAIKAILVGPIAGLILILGNVGVILGLFPFHVTWTVYSLIKTNRFGVPLKVAFLLGLPGLCGVWLGLAIAVSVLVGVGYGFFTPWISAFEAFRLDGHNESKKFIHCIVDGTWDTIKGSCTVVRDFADLCYHSYPLYLEELREVPTSDEPQTLRFIHVPGCVVAGLMGLIVEIPLYTVIAIVKSPYLLFMGWYRLLHDLVTREGPFLESACIPVAGLTILLWPLIVIGSVIFAIISSFFVGLYASVIVYQERSFRKGAAYVIAMVAEFDEYTNDWLYLREGTVLPKPRYRRKNSTHSTDFSDGGSRRRKPDVISNEAPAMLVPNLVHSCSVREAIQEVQAVQIWEQMMKSCLVRGKQLIDTKAIKPADLIEWNKAKSGTEANIIGVGLPTYSLLVSLVNSIKYGAEGFLMIDGLEVNYLNRPQDRLMDWFFQPVMVLKEHIKVIKMEEGEIKFLEKIVLYYNEAQRMETWDNGSVVPQDPVRAAQIQGISRRLTGIARSVSKLPTYRRRYSQVVKGLLTYALDLDYSTKSGSIKSVASVAEIV